MVEQLRVKRYEYSIEAYYSDVDVIIFYVHEQRGWFGCGKCGNLCAHEYMQNILLWDFLPQPMTQYVCSTSAPRYYAHTVTFEPLRKNSPAAEIDILMTSRIMVPVSESLISRSVTGIECGQAVGVCGCCVCDQPAARLVLFNRVVIRASLFELPDDVSSFRPRPAFKHTLIVIMAATCLSGRVLYAVSLARSCRSSWCVKSRAPMPAHSMQ